MLYLSSLRPDAEQAGGRPRPGRRASRNGVASRQIAKGELTTITFIVIDEGGMALGSHASREGAIGAVNNRVETALSFLVKQSRQRAA